MRFLPIIAAFVALHMVAAPAAAQSTPATCAATPDDVERLACYDALFGIADDDPEPAIELLSEQQIPAFPSGRGNASLALACVGGQLELRFGFAGNVISATGSTTGITLQRDLLRAQAITLPPNADGTQLVLVGNTEVTHLIQSLRGVTNLGVRVTPASSRSLNVRFRVENLPADAGPVIAGCQ